MIDYGDDADNQQLKVLLHKGNATKEVASSVKSVDQVMPPSTLKDDKVAPVHAAHAGNKGHKGADKRKEAAQEDGQVTPTCPRNPRTSLMRSGVMALTLPEAMIFCQRSDRS